MCVLFSSLGLEALWHSVLENGRTDILTFTPFTQSLYSEKCHLPTDLLYETGAITQFPHTMSALFDWTLCFEFLGSIWIVEDTVETHNTWECALRQSWEAARTKKLDLNDHRWRTGFSKSLLSKTPFSSSGFFYHSQNIGTWRKSGLPWTTVVLTVVPQESCWNSRHLIKRLCAWFKAYPETRMHHLAKLSLP